MKYLLFAVCPVLLLFIISSCEKSTFGINQLSGKWTIVSDSTSTNDACDGCINGSTYMGETSDYYDFSDDGTLSIEENGSRYTATYSLMLNDQINIATYYGVNGGGVFIYPPGFHGPLTFSITNLTYTISDMTEHSLILMTSGTYTPTESDISPIHYIEIIHLKR